MKKFIILLLLFLPAAVCLGSDKYAQLLETAETNFTGGNYGKAIEIYETLVQIEKVNDPFIYYNLSNAYYRNGELGKAVVNIEKAFLLSPGDKDIQHNRTFLNMKAGVEEEKGFSAFLSGFVNMCSLNAFTVISAVFFILALLLGSFYIIKRKKILRTVVFCVLPFLILSAALTAVKINNEILNVTAAVLKDAIVRSGPG
ncbi:MAG: tetratricopeptide repeat protein, partial [Endomicrobium sp.]|nr:tetratricopeptide repeat protein [Endomicrobium sp.]